MMETFIYVRSTELYPVYEVWFIRNWQNLLHFHSMHKLLHDLPCRHPLILEVCAQWCCQIWVTARQSTHEYLPDQWTIQKCMDWCRSCLPCECVHWISPVLRCVAQWNDCAGNNLPPEKMTPANPSRILAWHLLLQNLAQSCAILQQSCRTSKIPCLA